MTAGLDGVRQDQSRSSYSTCRGRRPYLGLSGSGGLSRHDNAEMVQFFLQMPDFKVCLESYTIVTLSSQSVLLLGTSLAHQNNQHLHCGQTRKNKIQKNERIRIKCNGPATLEFANIQAPSITPNPIRKAQLLPRRAKLSAKRSPIKLLPA
jgi:hypothetical protein